MGTTRTWTRAKVAALAKYREAGDSFAKAAKKLGVTANAAIGAADRFRKTMPDFSGPVSQRMVDRPEIDPSLINEAGQAIFKPRYAIVPSSILEGSERGSCQWIEGEPKDRNFCHAPVRSIGHSWCNAHHARAYTPCKPR